MDQNDSDVGLFDSPVDLCRTAHKVVHFRTNLHARKPASCDHKGKQLLPQLEIRFNVSFLEDMNHVVTQENCVGEVFEGHGMLGQAHHASKIRNVAERENEIVVTQHVGSRAEALTECDNLLLDVERFDVAHNKAACVQKAANGTDGVEDTDAS